MRKLDPDFRKALDVAFDTAVSHLEHLDESSVAATAGPVALRAQVAKPLAEEGMPPQQVIEELVRDVEGGLLGTAGGRFFGWVIGGALPAAVAADWLASAWQQNAALYACSPAAAIVEETVGVWLKDILRLPAHASFALVTGCQMAHVTCLAAARHALLSKRGWDVESQGLYGAPPIRILSSSERHGSFERAIRLLGFGRTHLKLLAVDDECRLRPDALEEELRKGDGPTIVLLQAGDINVGAYDSFEAIIPLAKRHGAWVHVDGAFGLWAAASPNLRHLVNGVAAADSWATDGHKWLNLPFDSGFAFVADAAAHRASLSLRAAYLTHASDARDQMDWNPEWSRRARAFPAYAALRQLGRQGIADLIDRCCRHARAIVTRIGKLPGAEVLWTRVINQGLVRFLDHRAAGQAFLPVQSVDRRSSPVQSNDRGSSPTPGSPVRQPRWGGTVREDAVGSTDSIRGSSPTVREGSERGSTAEDAHDRRTDEVIAAIQKTGEAFFGGTTWRGRRAMRVSVCNWQTSDEDVERVVKAVASVLTSNR